MQLYYVNVSVQTNTQAGLLKNVELGFFQDTARGGGGNLHMLWIWGCAIILGTFGGVAP